jgi:uncharacterized protein
MSRPAHLIRISSLPEGANDLRIQFPPDLFAAEPNPVTVHDVVAEFNLFRSRGQVYLSGTVRFTAHLTCADCAEPFEQTFAEPVSLELQQGIPQTKTHKVIDLGGDELGRLFYSGDEIDLLPLVRDTLLLAVPIAPVCRPDCKGLCPDCGASLNASACTCKG